MYGLETIKAMNREAEKQEAEDLQDDLDMVIHQMQVDGVIHGAKVA